MSRETNEPKPSSEVAQVIFVACRIYGEDFAKNIIDGAFAELRAEAETLRSQLEKAKSERVKLYSVLKELHETTCPYKPFATVASFDTPEDVPACTCSNQKKARYWAVEDFLHRAEIEVLKEHLSLATQALEKIAQPGIGNRLTELYESIAKSCLAKLRGGK